MFSEIYFIQINFHLYGRLIDVKSSSIRMTSFKVVTN